MSVAAAQAHHETERRRPARRPHKTCYYRERLPIRNGELGGFHAVQPVLGSKLHQLSFPLPFLRDGQFELRSPLPVADLRSVRVLDAMLSPPGFSPLIFTQRGFGE